MAPLDYGPVLLRLPFGFGLATDTLSSFRFHRKAGEALLPPLDGTPLIRASEGLKPS